MATEIVTDRFSCLNYRNDSNTILRHRKRYWQTYRAYTVLSIKQRNPSYLLVPV